MSEELTDTERVAVEEIARSFDDVVARFRESRSLIETFLTQITAAIAGQQGLASFIHSRKERVKSEASLRDKLQRKAIHSVKKNIPFDITPGNLLESVTDLAGFRILHLHSRQIESIHPMLLAAFAQWRFDLRESFARVWDDESRALYEKIGLRTEPSDRMYTSVHYVVASNSEVRFTGEVQVRTLAEELWGEVDHTINYPSKSPSPDCQEQIKVLARLTSACTRLVDSVFDSHRRATTK